MSADAGEFMGRQILGDAPGFEGPIQTSSAPASALSIVTFTPRPEQMPALLAIAKQSAVIREKYGAKVRVLRSLFSGGPIGVAIAAIFDGGVAAMLEGWDDYIADPDAAAVQQALAAAGLSFASSSTWARIPV